MTRPVESSAGVYGPYTISDSLARAPQEFLTVPFARVRNATVLVTFQDNLLKAIDLGTVADSGYARVTYELVISGLIKGYEDVLARIQTNGTYSPIKHNFWDEEGSYSQIRFSTRVLFGGHPGQPSDLEFDQEFEAAAVVRVQERQNSRGKY